MGSNNSLIVIALSVFCILIAQPARGQDELLPSDSSIHPSIGDESASQGSGFFGLLLRPIRATIESARKFLGDRIDNVSGGLDTVRLQSFQIFMGIYNKTYTPEELPTRMALYFERLRRIEESIRNYREGKSLFSLKENEFTDWSDDEIKKLAGVSMPEKLSEEELAEVDDEPEVRSSPNEIDVEDSSRMVKQESIPASKDWRSSGCISRPINQMKCGACYAIATMGVVESMRCISNSSSPILSSQQIVDCSTPRAGYQNFGCDGGWPTRVLKYLQDVGTVTRETCYPFERVQHSSCKLRQMQSTSGCTLSASVTNTGRINYKVLTNERDILYHVAKTGPVVTVMKANDDFLYFGNGIFSSTRGCTNSRDDVDHAISIVGYGNENGVNYWIIKNSWGTTTWGQGGYAKYLRGRNVCSIGHWGWVVTK